MPTLSHRLGASTLIVALLLSACTFLGPTATSQDPIATVGTTLAPEPTLTRAPSTPSSSGDVETTPAPTTTRLADLEPTRGPTAGPTPTGSTPVAQTTAAAPGTIGPALDRDPLDLAKRYRFGPGTPAPTLVIPTERPPEGEVRQFWINDESERSYIQVPARLIYSGDFVDVYSQDGLDADRDAVANSVKRFESEIYPTLLEGFANGRELLAGRRVTILNARLTGVLGQFSSADAYPRSVNLYSNERAMLYMNGDYMRAGTDEYDSVLSHEFAHMLQFLLDPTEDSWVDEGTAEYAMSLAGYDSGGSETLYFSHPDTQLNSWAEDLNDRLPHYGGAQLFFTYLADHYGGPAAISAVLADLRNSVPPIDDYLRRVHGRSFDEVFADWTVANFLNDATVDDGRYGYKELQGEITEYLTIDSVPYDRQDDVSQYAAQYYSLWSAGWADGEGIAISFAGEPVVPVIANEPTSGEREWWSGRGDGMNTRLTRMVDLTGVRDAKLEFTLWYDIELDYDYGYVAVSTDGGETWRTLPGRESNQNNPNGANFGFGWTGHSGGGDEPIWIDEEVDLSALAGQSFLLRFEYVTDDAVHGDGLTVDDLAIEAIGWTDDVESDQHSGWTSDGFVPLANSIAQDYAVHVIVMGPNATRVERIKLDQSRQGMVELAGLENADQVVVVVAAIAPDSTQPASFQIAADPLEPGG